MTPCDADGNLISDDASARILGEEGVSFAANAFVDVVCQGVSAISSGVAGEGISEDDFVYVHYLARSGEDDPEEEEEEEEVVEITEDRTSKRPRNDPGSSGGSGDGGSGGCSSSTGNSGDGGDDDEPPAPRRRTVRGRGGGEQVTYHVVVIDGQPRLVKEQSLYLDTSYMDVEMNQVIVAGFDEDLVEASFTVTDGTDVDVTSGTLQIIKRAAGFSKVGRARSGRRASVCVFASERVSEYTLFVLQSCVCASNLKYALLSKPTFTSMFSVLVPVQETRTSSTPADINPRSFLFFFGYAACVADPRIVSLKEVGQGTLSVMFRGANGACKGEKGMGI
jgi:hypothetical protein